MSAFDEASEQGSSSSLSARLLGNDSSAKQSQQERDYEDLLHLVKRFRFQSRCVLEAVDEYKRERTPFLRGRLDQQAESARASAREAADAFREKPGRGGHDARRNKLRRDLQKEMSAFDAVVAQLPKLPPPLENPGGVLRGGGDVESGRGGSFDSGDGQVIQLKQTLDLTDDASYEAHMAQEREREFRELASQARQVKDVYADLANLVEEQKESVDTIETDAVKAHERTMSGVNQVQRAMKHQRSRSCMMKCVCVVSIIMVLVILVLLFVLKK